MKEITLWAPTPMDYNAWKRRLAAKRPILVIDTSKVLGFAEVSITAKPFFLAMDFRSIRPNLVCKSGYMLKNYVMVKEI